MKKYISTLTLLTFAIIANAQIFNWAQYIGGMPDGNDVSTSANGKISTLDAFGHIYVVSPGYLKKFDASTGNSIWSANTGYNGFSIKADSIGYIYIAGNSGGTAFVEKRDSAGTLVWTRTIDGADLGTDICVDAQVNVYAVGHFTDSTDFDPGIGTHFVDTGGAFLLKLDSAGNFLWVFTETQTITNTLRYNTVAIDRANNVYVASVGGHTPFWSGYIKKINNSGTEIWRHNYQTTLGSDVLGIKITDSDFVYTLGMTNYKGGQSGMLLVNKMDTSGSEIWINEFRGEVHSWEGGIDVDEEGSVYVAGSTVGGTITDAGIPVSTYGAPNMYIFKFSPTGDVLWSTYHLVGMMETKKSHGYNIAVDDGCNLYITGVIQGELDVCPGPYTYMLNGNGLFLEKLMCQSLGLDGPSVGPSTITAYPNPTNGFITIKSPVTIDALQVKDILGRIVYCAYPEKSSLAIDLEVSSGVYYLTTVSGSELVTQKILAEE